MKALRRIQTTSSSSNPSSPLTSPRSPSSSSWIHLRSALFVVASSSPSSSSSDRSVFLLKLDLKILSLTSRTFQVNKSLLALNRTIVCYETFVSMFSGLVSSRHGPIRKGKGHSELSNGRDSSRPRVDFVMEVLIC